MSESNTRRKAGRASLWLIAAATCAAAAAPLKPNFHTNWNAIYPSSQTDDNVIAGTGSSCQLCHQSSSGGDGYNAYGWQVWQAWNAGASVSNAIVMAEPFDSDGDGASDVFEIDAGTQPGWKPGNTNTIHFKNGSTQNNQSPPSGILGSLNPACGTAVGYCTPGTSASGCQASLSTSGTPSASSGSGFLLSATSVEGAKDGLYFFGVNGRQANAWGNGTSLQCVTPPVKRAGLLNGTGTSGLCDGTFSQDLNAVWAANPSKNPGGGALVQAQLWYRDPQNTSNQTTSLSDAVEFLVCP